MKYYSDITKRFYETSNECVKAEEEALNEQIKAKQEKERIAAERKSRAAEVEEARKNMVAAQNKYKEVLEAFVKDYGSYHYSTTDTKDIPTLFQIFNPFLFD